MPGARSVRSLRPAVLATVAVAVAASFAQAPAAARAAAQPYLPGQLVVRFTADTTRAERARTRAEVGARVADAQPRGGAQLLDLGQGESVPAARAALERDPAVLYAEPNFRVAPDATTTARTPNDPRFGEQWHLARTQVPQAWGLADPFARPQPAVAVIDTGVEGRHPDLRDSLYTNPGESGAGREANGVDDDANGYVDDVHGWHFAYGSAADGDASDLDGHGTGVAGVLAATGDDGLGGAGVNPRARILPLSIYDEGSYGIAKAIAYADHLGVRVANGSFGFPPSQVIEDALAAAPDLLLTVSAGNQAWDVEQHPERRYPCVSRQPNVICVAATDHGDGLAGFSNWGAQSVDLAAPGVDLVSTGLPQRILLRDDFEAPLGDRWTTGGTGRTWERVPPPSEFGPDSGAAIEDSPGAPYDASSDSWIASAQPLDLSGSSRCALYYRYTGRLGAGDRLLVEASSADRGWTTLGEHTSAASTTSEPRPLTPVEDRPDVRLRFRLVSDASEQGAGVRVDDVLVFCRDPRYRGDEYVMAGGTSNAAPQVAGVATLLLARDPRLTTAQLRAAILDHVEPLPALAGRTVTGGRLNAYWALYGGRPPADPVPPATTTGAAPSSTPAAPSPAPRDRGAPRCRPVRAPRRARTSALGRRGLALAVRCDEAARVTVRLQAGRRTLARVRLAFAGPGTRRLRLRLLPAARLPRAVTVAATLRLTAGDAAGNRRVLARRFELRRR